MARPPRSPSPTTVPSDGTFSLGSILGIPIGVDPSWFVIFALIVATLSGGYFPGILPGRSLTLYLGLGVGTALLFFGSLLAHELAHSVVARRRGIEIEGITLFLFGGMARTRREPASPGDEFVIAGAGPLASIGIALVFTGLARAGLALGSEELHEVARHLGTLNLVLAIFNLLPGLPLDGGRLLRAVIWHRTGDLRRATRAASAGGRWIGYLLMTLGIVGFLAGGGLLGGIWAVLIGWFLVGAARASLRQLLISESLRGMTAAQGMTPGPETVPDDLSIEALVHDHLLRHPWSSYPVLRDGRLVGLITLSGVRGIPSESWAARTVADGMIPLAAVPTVSPELPMLEVLERIIPSPIGRALVTSDGELLGIISIRDLGAWMERSGIREAVRPL